MRTIIQFSLLLFILNIICIPKCFADKCQCYCEVYGEPGQNVCDRLTQLAYVSYTNSQKLLEWQELKPFVEYFSNRWKEEITDIVDTKINEYISAGKLHPKPEPLVSRLEDGMQNDFDMLPDSSKDGTNVVSNLLAKVEMVENKTLEVEEELKSERRVRRHLQQEVNKTQSSLIFLSDQLQNVTVPVDARMSQVETVLISTLDNMNKTIYEDHLKKLYYKVDGVVYQNETKKLGERLEHVEIELLGSDNSSIVSKLEDNFKTLEKSFYSLNSSVEEIVPRVELINDLASDVLIPRIATLENETVRKNDTTELETKIASLMKDADLMRAELANVSFSIQDIQDLKTLFEHLSEQWDTSLILLQNQIETLRNESLSRPPVQQNDDEANDIFQQNKLNYVSEDDYEDLEMVTSSLTSSSLQPDNDNLMNQVDTTTQSLEVPPEVNETNVREVSTTNYEKYLTLDPNENATTVKELYVSEIEESTSTTEESTSTTEESTSTTEEFTSTTEESTSTTEESTSNGEIIFEDFHEELSSCGKPEIEDDHLLVDVVNASNGRSQLKFGCRPIGLYIVSYPPVPPRCEGGLWKGPFPNCSKLPDPSTVDALGQELGGKISCRSTPFPNPTNCSQFFKCDHGKAHLFSCPNGLHFNAQSKVCDYPRLASCIPVKTIDEEKLDTFIPPIFIEPNNIDGPYSHLGTGSTGQLIVHPRSSFTLHCLYPDHHRNSPKWNVAYNTFYTKTRSNFDTFKGKNKMSVKVTAATVEDSGIYTCVTPLEVEHAIEVIVKVVVCPAFSLAEEYEDVYYRPTPEGEIRIMGTRAEFKCEEGHTIFRQCLSDGTWSNNGLPSETECKLKKKKTDDMWNCPVPDLSEHPYLHFERSSERKIVFKCAGGKRLIGYSYTRCKEDGHWTQPTLPRCK